MRDAEAVREAAQIARDSNDFRSAIRLEKLAREIDEESAAPARSNSESS